MDTAFFWLSKILWGIFSPSHFVIILLVLSVFFVNNIILKLVLRFASLFFIITLFIFPVGDWVLLPLEDCHEHANPPMNVDGVIVLGGAVNIAVSDERSAIGFNSAADRVMAMLKLLKVYPDAQFVYAGGTSSIKRPDFHEADYIKRFLDDLKIDTSKMVFEGQSRSTYEDASFTKENYAKTPRQSWLLVTSAFHMPRAMSLFRKMGEASNTQFFPYQVDYKTSGKFKFDINFDFLGNMEKFDTAMHEYVGIIMNKILHHSNDLWSCALNPTVLE